MSFKQSASAVSIVNRALDMVSESKTIASLDDPGHIAQVARRWYKTVVADLLETHHWGLATKQSSLVAVDNGRSSQWLYAYSTPDDMAFPVGIALSNGTSSINYYRGLSGLLALVYGRPIFQMHQGVIYSNVEGDLEYVSFDVTEQDFSPSFEEIVVLKLAAKFALAIPKDFDLSEELDRKALGKMNLVITQNLNTGKPQYGMQVSEGELARGSALGHSWDYFPRAPGS
jgi:hypothetical protein